jgi:hypothetical protein
MGRSHLCHFLHQESVYKFEENLGLLNCGFVRNLTFLTSGFTDARPICMFSSKRAITAFDRAQESILVGYRTGTTYCFMTKKSRRIVVARDVKLDEASLGLRTS